MMFRIRNTQVTIENLGTKVLFRRKMCGKVFMRKIVLELLIFFVFCDWCLRIHFKAIIFIHAAFIIKVEVFLKIFVQEMSNTPLILYFSHIFIFNTVLEKISGKIFFEKLTYTFYLTVPFCLKHNNVVYRWKVYEKTNNLTYNMLQSVLKCGSYCHFFSTYSVS